MINLCVTTFNRQDLLGPMLASVFAGSVKPDRLFIIDQSTRPSLVDTILIQLMPPCPIQRISLGDKRGCEGSAINWYLENVPEERVIAHEDVVFGYTSLEQFVAASGDFLIDSSLGVITYRDACQAAVGLYDVTISPNYFRYVDVDYEDRLGLAGIHPIEVPCGIQHVRNGTMLGYTSENIADYHRREGIACANYEKKWGRSVTPGGETLGRGAWRRQYLQVAQ